MKSIEITGKHNRDKINKIEKPQRQDSLKWNFSDDYYTNRKQIEIINKLYLDQEQEYGELFRKEINKKIQGYKNQDIQKKILDVKNLISVEDTIELLMTSKLKCYYCKSLCELIYKDIFAKNQWTLDRINNKKGHNYDNVVISCLDCNIKRGDMDSERFKKGKEIKVVRKLF
jgi:5-methylcytosine-specific restriction endonuclease McrA